MKKFEFNGYTTENIIDKRLLLLEFDVLESLPSSTRETEHGEYNPYREEANYYNTKITSTPTMTFALVKYDGTPFTITERSKIESILTSPTTPKPLIITSDEDVSTKFRGTFLSPKWKIIGGKIVGCIIDFENTSQYYYDSIECENSISTSKDISINCDNDNLENYVYPKIRIKKTTIAEDIVITNKTDNNKSLTLSLSKDDDITIDCKLCKIVNNKNGKCYSLKDMKLDELDYIYWVRFLHGINELEVIGSCDIVISAEIPKLGLGSYFE